MTVGQSECDCTICLILLSYFTVFLGSDSEWLGSVRLVVSPEFVGGFWRTAQVLSRCAGPTCQQRRPHPGLLVHRGLVRSKRNFLVFDLEKVLFWRADWTRFSPQVHPAELRVDQVPAAHLQRLPRSGPGPGSHVHQELSSPWPGCKHHVLW